MAQYTHRTQPMHRCMQWVRTIGRRDLKSKGVHTLHTSYFVCDLHFVNSDFLKKNLKRNAVPTLLLPYSEEMHGQSKFTQTDMDLPCSCPALYCEPQISCDLPAPSTSQAAPSLLPSSKITKKVSQNTRQRRKLQPNVDGKRQRLLESIVEYVTNAKESDAIPPLLKKIIDNQKLLKHNTQGHDYDEQYKMFALNVYFSNPAAYQIISKMLFLPNIRTLQKHIVVNISTKLDENLVRCLEAKIRTYSEAEKYCIISADKISLRKHLYYLINKDRVVGFHDINEKQTKELTNKAFIVMARGIFSNWTQPLAYCFFSQSKNYTELNNWLENIIAKMIEIGYNVRAFSTCQFPNFTKMTRNKHVSTQRPYFFVNNKKIYYIYDVPQVMNSLRNNFINYDFLYHINCNEVDHVASWYDIETLYEIEKSKVYKIAFKLTESHIKPSKYEKKRVKYAAQVLSRTVAAGIYALFDLGHVTNKSLGTTTFVELINDTFDILNSSAVRDDYKYKQAFCHADYQLLTLAKAQFVLSGLRIIDRQTGEDVTRSVKFIKQLLISIKAILSLAEDLKKEGYSQLFTRRLNHDPIRHFIRKLRSQDGKSRKPSAIQFHTGFKNLIIANIMKMSKNANTSQDLDQIVMSANKTESSGENMSTEPFHRTLSVETNDYRFEIPEINTFSYVCGYLLEKCIEHHKDCEIVNNYCKANEDIDENTFFTCFKSNRTDLPSGVLIKLPEDFIQYINQIDRVFEEHFEKDGFYHIGNELLCKISGIKFEMPCPCFPIEYLKKLFIRFRIFHVIQHNNKNFRDKSLDRKYFSMLHL